MTDQAPASALIVRMSSIGDVIHTLPAYAALRAAWPEARLGWVVEPAAAPLLERLDDGLQLHVVDTQRWRRRWWKPATRRRLHDAIGALRAARYDLALDFQGLLKSAVMARWARPQRVIGLAEQDRRERFAGRFYDAAAPPVPAGTHIIERSLGLAAAAGAAGDTIRFPRLFHGADETRIDEQLRGLGIDRYVVMHGAANWDSKRWGANRHAAVGAAVYRQTGLPVLWVWGPGEQADAHRLALAAGEGNHLAFPTSLPQLAALLHRAALFIGGDSAPLHLAVASGTPTVAVFGPTDPGVLGSTHPDDIAVVNRLPCSFCHRRRCPIGTRECLEGLGADDVVAAALQRLAHDTARAG